jgi:hypothetical protein
LPLVTPRPPLSWTENLINRAGVPSTLYARLARLKLGL